MESRSDWNEAALTQVRHLGGDALLHKLIELFLSTSPGRVADARAAVARGDLPEVVRAAHALKSSAGNLGAQRVYDLCQAIEVQANQGAAGGLDALAADLEAAYAQAAARLLKLKEPPG